MSDKLVVNELLAFLQQKLDDMDEVSVVQICSTSFSEKDVAAAKLLLYKSLNKCDQMVSRRRDGTKKSLQDIITLLKETDPNDVPTFVAKDLNKLPPVTFDHVDVSSLMKDIVSLKASLADVHRKLEASENSVSVLRVELDKVRNAVAVSGSSALDNINTRQSRGECDTSVTSFASAVLSPRNAEPAVSAACVRHCAAPVPVPAAPLSTAARQKTNKKQATASTPAAHFAKIRVTEKVTNTHTDDGFVTVQKRKRRQRTIKNCCGTAPAQADVSLRAAAPNTPVYISRLHYTTRAEDIVEYVRRKSKYTPRVQLLESRRNVNFKAFVVRVPTCFLHIFMEEDFWPMGVVFRRFRGQVPHERTETLCK